VRVVSICSVGLSRGVGVGKFAHGSSW
jgi:hypothetical protein